MAFKYNWIVRLDSNSMVYLITHSDAGIPLKSLYRTILLMSDPEVDTKTETKQTQRYYKIDCHTHILPSKLPSDYYTRYKEGPTYVTFQPCSDSCNVRMYKGGQFFREVEPNCFHPDARLLDMERTDVDVQVLSTVPVMMSYWPDPDDALDFSRLINDELLEIAETHPNKFVVLGTVPLNHPEQAIKELRRIMDLGAVGVQIGSNVNGEQLSEPKFFPFFEECEHLNACIFVHPWNMPREKETSKYWLPWLVGMPMETTMAICSFIFGAIFDRLPKLRVMFAHGGGSFPGTIGRIEHGWRCRPDLVRIHTQKNPREFLGKFWVDSLVHDDDALGTLHRLIGADKIVLGSDYPFPLGEDVPGLGVETSSHLSEDAKAKILWQNAFEWLGISAKRFEAAIDEAKQKAVQKSNEKVVAE